MSSINPDNKTALIKSIQETCKFWDSTAQSDAIESARNPKDKELQSRATASVARSDAVHNAEKEIIQKVHQFWPQEKSPI